MVKARNTAGTNLLMVAATTGNTDVLEAVVSLLEKKLAKEQVQQGLQRFVIASSWVFVVTK